MSAGEPLTIVYYVSGHGFGHATRVVEVTRHLIAAGHTVHVVTGAPHSIWTAEIDSPRLHFRKVLLDSGAVQSDALTVDRMGSLLAYETLFERQAEIVDGETAFIRSVGADLVVVDIAPMACTAARRAGVRCVVCTNFTWDYIYAEYVETQGTRFRVLCEEIANDYAKADLLLRLPGFTPMPAFRRVEDVPLVVRMARTSRDAIRARFGLSPATKVADYLPHSRLRFPPRQHCTTALRPASERPLPSRDAALSPLQVVIYNFGGQPSGWTLRESFLPPGWVCLVCTALQMPELPRNFVKPPYPLRGLEPSPRAPSAQQLQQLQQLLFLAASHTRPGRTPRQARCVHARPHRRGGRDARQGGKIATPPNARWHVAVRLAHAAPCRGATGGVRHRGGGGGAQQALRIHPARLLQRAGYTPFPATATPAYPPPPQPIHHPHSAAPFCIPFLCLCSFFSAALPAQAALRSRPGARAAARRVLRGALGRQARAGPRRAAPDLPPICADLIPPPPAISTLLAAGRPPPPIPA